MEYECLRCGKKVTSTWTPEGWIIRYDGVLLCDECQDKQDYLLDFLSEVKEAIAALESATRVLDNSNILIGRRREIRGQLQATIAKLKQMIVDCRKRKPTEEELRQKLEEYRAIVLG